MKVVRNHFVSSFVSLSHYRTISPSSHIHHPHSEIRNAHNNYSELEIMPSPSPQAMPSLSTPSPQVSIGHTQHPNPAQMLSILNSNLNNPNHSHLSNSNSGKPSFVKCRFVKLFFIIAANNTSGLLQQPHNPFHLNQGNTSYGYWN